MVLNKYPFCARVCDEICPPPRLTWKLSSVFAASSSSSSFAAGLYCSCCGATTLVILPVAGRQASLAAVAAMATLADVCPHHKTEREGRQPRWCVAPESDACGRGFVNKVGSAVSKRGFATGKKTPGGAGFATGNPERMIADRGPTFYFLVSAAAPIAC